MSFASEIMFWVWFGASWCTKGIKAISLSVPVEVCYAVSFGNSNFPHLFCFWQWPPEKCASVSAPEVLPNHREWLECVSIHAAVFSMVSAGTGFISATLLVSFCVVNLQMELNYLYAIYCFCHSASHHPPVVRLFACILGDLGPWYLNTLEFWRTLTYVLIASFQVFWIPDSFEFHWILRKSCNVGDLYVLPSSSPELISVYFGPSFLPSLYMGPAHLLHFRPLSLIPPQHYWEKICCSLNWISQFHSLETTPPTLKLLQYFVWILYITDVTFGIRQRNLEFTPRNSSF